MWLDKDPPIAEKRAYLDALGFRIGERDPRGINTNYPGRYMVAEDCADEELPTEDGSNGPWCIVGDDLDALIAQAWSVWYDFRTERANFERAMKIAEEGGDGAI